MVSKKELDTIVEFYEARLGANEGFLFSDPSDYLLTPYVSKSRFGSYTQGVVKVGESKNWATKAYSILVGGYWHTFNRLITRPDLGMLVDGVLVQPIAGTGEISGAYQPFTSVLSGTFKVPVRFAEDSLKITPLSLDKSVGYASIGGVVLEEVREGFSADYINFRQPSLNSDNLTTLKEGTATKQIPSFNLKQRKLIKN